MFGGVALHVHHTRVYMDPLKYPERSILSLAWPDRFFSARRYRLQYKRPAKFFAGVYTAGDNATRD